MVLRMMSVLRTIEGQSVAMRNFTEPLSVLVRTLPCAGTLSLSRGCCVQDGEQARDVKA